MNYFSHNPLDRRFDLRTNRAQLELLRKHPQAQFLLLHNNLHLLRELEDGQLQPVSLSWKEAEALEPMARVFLGLEGEVPYFVLGFEEQAEELTKYLQSPFVFKDLKDVALQLPPEESAILAHARALLHWNLRHLYCPNCGSLTVSMEAGHMRQCTNESCGLHHFPRTDTAVIMLISEGNACLLGRQAAWPKYRYATLAGFLEPGETLEQAVAREAKEETGVQLASITYHSSQPWPFPASVMVGFMATASTRDLEVNYAEMEDARWFTRDAIADGLREGTFLPPPQVSISFRLIRDWYNADPAYRLEDVLEGLPRL